MKRIFSQSLQKQALIAMAIGIIPILILTLWYAQKITQNQRQTNEIYNENQKLILNYNFLKADIISIEKAHRNNQLLQSNQLQNSIEQKWLSTQEIINLLLEQLPGSEFVAKWQQTISLDVKSADDFAQLIIQIKQLDQVFNHTIRQRLHKQHKIFETSQTHFVLGLSILLPLLIILSSVLILRVCRRLNQVEMVVAKVGSGQLDEPIALTGSRELKQLGLKLDWLRTELKRIQQQKETFLRHVTHELKTPLASINEGASLLTSTRLGDINAKQTRILNIVQASVKNLAQLIDDLLNYSAASHPEGLSQREKLSYIKSEVMTHLDKSSERSTSEVKWQIQEELLIPYVPCKLIMIQLLSNGLKYADSCVTLRCEQVNDTIELEVHDDGKGLDSNDMDKLFQPFVQAENKHNNSSGLGLAIAAECTAQLKGTIQWLDSKKGARILVTFPNA